MNTNLIFAALFLGIVVVNCYYWRKRKDKDHFYAALIWLVGVFVNVLDYGIDNIFHSSTAIRHWSDVGVRLILPILVVASLIVYFKGQAVKTTPGKPPQS